MPNRVKYYIHKSICSRTLLDYVNLRQSEIINEHPVTEYIYDVIISGVPVYPSSSTCNSTLLA